MERRCSHIALGTPVQDKGDYPPPAIRANLSLEPLWERPWEMQEQMSEQQPGRPGLEELLLLSVMVLLGMGNYLGDVQYWTAAICHLISSAI